MRLDLPYRLFLNTVPFGGAVLVRAKSLTDAKQCPNLISNHIVEIVDSVPTDNWSRKTILNALHHFNFKDRQNIWRKCEVSEEVFHYLDKNMQGNIVIYDHTGDKNDLEMIKTMVEECSFLQPDVIQNTWATDVKFENGLIDVDIFLETRKAGTHVFFVFPANISTESLFRIKYSIDTICPDMMSYLHFYIYREGRDKLYQVQLNNDVISLINPTIYKV